MERKSMDSFYDFSDEELEKRKSDFKQKYCKRRQRRGGIKSGLSCRYTGYGEGRRYPFNSANA